MVSEIALITRLITSTLLYIFSIYYSPFICKLNHEIRYAIILISRALVTLNQRLDMRLNKPQYLYLSNRPEIGSL